jgi:hypothetical protein
MMKQKKLVELLGLDKKDERIKEHVIGHTSEDLEEDVSTDYYNSIMSIARAWGGSECPFQNQEEAEEFLFGDSPKHHISSIIRFVKN